MSEFPNRVDGLEVNEVSDGYIVYQPEQDRVHYLNHTAALVFELCNGENAAAEIPELLREAYDLGSAPAAEVKDCLERFRNEGIIRSAS